MSLDPEKTPFLFSVGTQLAYEINKNYYGNIHYVWCTTKYHDISQPITSDPQCICKGYIDQIITKDRHANNIENNIKGILKGVDAKINDNVITLRQQNIIMTLLSESKFSDYYPVIYIINTKDIVNRCHEVPENLRANPDSVEYLIYDLKDSECEIIFLKTLYDQYDNKIDFKIGSMYV